jgi:hypothetical protein
MKTELKIIKKGDSLVGTSYYYFSKTQFRRYAIKGYFDTETNSVIWWDDILLEEKGNIRGLGANNGPLLSVADFNCPGETTMLLEGNSTSKDDKDKNTGPVDMKKTTGALFPDEWDYVLENYFVGANHPDIIDSVSRIALVEPTIPPGFEGTLTPPHARAGIPFQEQQRAGNVAKSNQPPGGVSGSDLPRIVENASGEPPVVVKAEPPVVVDAEPPIVADAKTPNHKQSLVDRENQQLIEQKFATRTNKLQTVIPVTSQKIELRFYDNAQVDGDSIALFLNGKMLFKNIRLTDQPYTVFIDAKDLLNDNELVMVAENLGSIPPNTSFMVAIVGDKRYEARLYANENSSALIRFIRQ